MDVDTTHGGGGDPAVIAFLGTSAKAGKTVFARGSSRLLSNQGHRVAPLKPVTVARTLQPRDGVTLDPRVWWAGEAARWPVSHDNVPVQVLRIGPAHGRLFVRARCLGSVELLGEDTPLLADLPDAFSCARDAVDDAFRTLSSSADVVVVEGAGSCTDLSEEVDLANWRLPLHAGARTVLVAGAHAGGSVAGLHGGLAELGDRARARVAGIALNDVRAGQRELERRVRRLAERFEVRYLGALPHCTIWSDIPPGHTSSLMDSEAEYEYLAQFLAAHVDIDAVMPSRGTASLAAGGSATASLAADLSATASMAADLSATAVLS